MTQAIMDAMANKTARFVNVDTLPDGSVVVAVHACGNDASVSMKPETAEVMARLLLSAAEKARRNAQDCNTIDLTWRPKRYGEEGFVP